MKLKLRTGQALIALFLLSVAFPAGAALDKLGRVKAGNARETPHKEVADPIDGLLAASATELKKYCSSLKRERRDLAKELDDRIQAARIADGTSIDPKQLPKTAQVDIRKQPKPKDAKTAANSSEAQETKRVVAEAFARKATLTCLLYSTREIQAGRTKKKVPTTKALVKRCYEGREVPGPEGIDCEGDESPGTGQK